LLVARLHDPNGLTVAARSANPQFSGIIGPPLSVTIAAGSGAAQALPFSRNAADVWEFSSLVPAATSFTVRATSPALLLGDALGNSLAANAYQAIITTSGDSDVAAPSIPLWRYAPPAIPSTVIEFVAKGLVSP